MISAWLLIVLGLIGLLEDNGLIAVVCGVVAIVVLVAAWAGAAVSRYYERTYRR